MRKKHNPRFYDFLAAQFPEFAVVRSSQPVNNIRNGFPDHGKVKNLIKSTVNIHSDDDITRTIRENHRFNNSNSLDSLEDINEDSFENINFRNYESEDNFSPLIDRRSEIRKNVKEDLDSSTGSTTRLQIKKISSHSKSGKKCQSSFEKVKHPHNVKNNKTSNISSGNNSRLSSTIPYRRCEPIIVPALPAVCYKRKDNKNITNLPLISLDQLQKKNAEKLQKIIDKTDDVEATSKPLQKEVSVTDSNVLTLLNTGRFDTSRSYNEFNVRENYEDDDENELDFTVNGIPPIPIPKAKGPNDLVVMESPPFSLSPFTYIDEVTQLNDADLQQYIEEDALFVKSLTSNGNRFDNDTIYDFCITLTENQYQMAFSVVSKQFFKFAQILHWLHSLVNCETPQEYAARVERACKSIFLCRTCLFWMNIESAEILMNYSMLMKVPHGKGIIGTCCTDKREIVAPNPMCFPLYDEEIDLPFCEEAEIIVVEPIRFNNRILGTVLLVDKVHPSGATYSYWPQSELFLLRFFVEHLAKSFATMNNSTRKTAKLYRILGSYISRQSDFAKLLSIIKTSLVDLINCESVTVFFKESQRSVYYYEQVGNRFVRRNVELEKAGIVTNVFLEKKGFNWPVASSDNKFNTALDGQYANRPAIAMPLLQGKENELIGAIICRGKKDSSPCFMDDDYQWFTMISAVASPCLQSGMVYRKKLNELRLALQAQDRLAMLLQTAESLSRETSIDHTITQIMNNAKELTGADRVSMFVVDETETHLISKVAQGTKNAIMIPINAGIAGSVATTGEVINIPDVYEDPRFNANVDKKTGYVTKSMVTIPVKDQKGKIIAVAQLMNKLSGEPFSDSDVELTKAMCVFSGIALANSRVIEMAVASTKRFEAMMETSLLLMHGNSLSSVIHHIMSSTRDLMNADRNSLFLMNKQTSKVQTHVTEGGSDVKIEVEEGKGVVGFIAKHGVVVNIPDAYKDNRFHSGVDLATGYRTRSILGCPIRGADNEVIGVVEMINKDMLINGGIFTKEDEQLVTAFSSFAGIAFEKHRIEQNQPKVAIELSSMVTAEENNNCEPPFRICLTKEKLERLISNYFDITKLYPVETVCVVASFFYSLDLTTTFRITNSKLIRFLLAVYESCNDKILHTWNKAVESVQFMYFLIKKIELDYDIPKLDQLVLLICALCHDIDHFEQDMGGIEGPFQILYRNRPIMEMHHCEEIVTIINESEQNIFENISPEDATQMWLKIYDLILATNPSTFYMNMTRLGTLVRPNFIFKFQNKSHRTFLYKAMVIACDLCRTVNSFELCKEWAQTQWEGIINPKKVIPSFNSKQREQFNRDKFLNIKMEPSPETLEETRIRKEKMLSKIVQGVFICFTEPLFLILKDIIPQMDECLTQMNSNYEEWKKITNDS
ncbi:GAF domain containing protein [Tritrichomonas foetus]|uniref:GAF domain containing protein n=1 Tax=Tritrichomonas foetus TaxID=1144522 RepID=A0A1J4KSR1_9EUKA|nr:GAF domain containing protein [Tritrichomonas foetus]|eukprot:OHT14327.1 GAF domain containing protein [Tritrichomonas foetus]